MPTCEIGVTLVAAYAWGGAIAYLAQELKDGEPNRVLSVLEKVQPLLQHLMDARRHKCTTSFIPLLASMPRPLLFYIFPCPSVFFKLSFFALFAVQFRFLSL